MATSGKGGRGRSGGRGSVRKRVKPNATQGDLPF